MAGYIFSVSKNLMSNVKEENIKNGYFTPFTPEITEEEMVLEKSRKRKSINKVLAATFADFVTMKAGDNVYFLSDRKIYGVGTLKNIGDDCKYDNYLNASMLLPNCRQRKLNYLTTENSRARWVCFFEPGNHFMLNGVDMDDVLRYKPSSFKMLRAFEGLSFIKIDDEENRALKEYLYIINESEISNSTGCLDFDDTLHINLEKMVLDEYKMDINKALNDEDNKEFVISEMFIEAALLQRLSIGSESVFGNWDFLTHQLIASPFKPLEYIDKMDIYGYRFSECYPDNPKLESKYILIELKKGKINKAALEQTMQYVDWVCKEYAYGDYSRIEAYLVGEDTVRNIDDIIKKYCQRNYIIETHPVKTSYWNNLHLVKYLISTHVDFQNIECNDCNPTI